MKDIVGQDIKVGSKVGYAVRKGSRVQIEVGTVSEVDIVLYEGRPDHKGANVAARGGKQSYKDARELLVYSYAQVAQGSSL